MPQVTIEMSELNVAIRNRVAEYESHREAARALNVAPQTIINWCSGSHVAIKDAAFQKRLALFLGVAPANILRMAGYDLSTRVNASKGGYLRAAA